MADRAVLISDSFAFSQTPARFSLHQKTLDTELVHCVVCLFTPLDTLVLITPTNEAIARLS